MKRHPLKLMGTIFAAIAAVEAVLCLPFLLENSEAAVIAAGVLGLQSLIFGGIGAGFLLHVRKKERLREELLSNGFCETAVVTETERVYSVRINSRHPYRVVCRVERGGVLHEYRSDMLMHDPGLLPGDPVRLYLDRRDDNRYYVDVESAAPTIIRHG